MTTTNSSMEYRAYFWLMAGCSLLCLPMPHTNPFWLWGVGGISLLLLGIGSQIYWQTLRWQSVVSHYPANTAAHKITVPPSAGRVAESLRESPSISFSTLPFCCEKFWETLLTPPQPFFPLPSCPSFLAAFHTTHQLRLPYVLMGLDSQLRILDLLGDPLLLRWLEPEPLRLRFFDECFALSPKQWPLLTQALQQKTVAFDLHYQQREFVVWCAPSADQNTLMVLMALRHPADDLLHGEWSQADSLLASQSTQVRHQFLATISHELRTPMTAILGYAEALLDAQPTPVQIRLIESIHQQSEHLLNQIDHLLEAVHRNPAPAPSPSGQTVELRPWLQDLLERFRPHARTRFNDIQVHLDERLPQRLFIPTEEVRYILVGLLSNALKFSQSGPIRIEWGLAAKPETISTAASSTAWHQTETDPLLQSLGSKTAGMVTTAETSSGDGISDPTRTSLSNLSSDRLVLVMQVSDQGVGMTAEQVQLAFEPFTQSGTSLTRSHGGLGLGLSLVRERVDQLGGTIHLASRVGHGCQVTVHLPVASCPPEDCPVDANSPTPEQFNQETGTAKPVSERETEQETDLGAVASVPKEQDESQSVHQTIMRASLVHSLGLDPIPAFHSVGPQQCHTLEPGLSHHPIYDDSAFATQAVPDHPSHWHVAQESRATETPRVLVVEDCPDNQRILNYFLRKLGLAGVVVDNGQKAIEAGFQNDWDLILMDLQMPVLDGYTATRQLRAGGVVAPIIAITAHALPEERERCLAIGCTDFLTKPITFGRFEETISRHLADATA